MTLCDRCVPAAHPLHGCPQSCALCACVARKTGLFLADTCLSYNAFHAQATHLLHFAGPSCSRSRCADAETAIRGLKVRLGVATGTVATGEPVKGSAVMEVARIVGDAGNGGQTLVDHATFLRIKDRLHELGAVDHSGLNLGCVTRFECCEDALLAS